MRLAELIVAVVIAAFSAYLMWKSGEGPSWNPAAERFANIGINVNGEGPGSGFWPFWLSGVMLLASLAIIVNWFRRATPQSRSDEPFLDGYGYKMLILVGGGLIGFLALIPYIGFYGGIFVFLVYYVGFLGRHRLFVTLPIAVGTPVVCFFFFDVAMRVVLPKGRFLEPLFIPLYDIFL